jgi:MFS family permease
MLVSAMLLQQAYGLAFAWGVLAPHLRSEAGWPAVLVGAVFSATPLGYGIGTVVGGRLAERVPLRRICLAGVVLLVVGAGVALTLPAPPTFILCYGLLALGVGGGLALTGSVPAVVRLAPARAGAAGGAITAAYAAAAIVQAPVLARLIPLLGWLDALRLLVALLAALAVVALLLMPRPLPAGPAGGREPRPRPPSQLALLRRPRVWSGDLLVLVAALLGPYAAVNVAGEAQASQLPAWVGPTAVALFSLGNAGGRLASGATADRLGVDRVAAAVLASDAAAAVLFALGPPVGPFLAAAVAAGAGLGGAAGLPSRMAADAAPDAASSAFGLLFAGYATGALLGPLAGAAGGGGSASWAIVGLPVLAGFGLLALRGTGALRGSTRSA